MMEDVNSSWDSCHIDIWFLVSKYLRPEDTLVFAQICKLTSVVCNSEAYWKGLYARFIKSKYPWLDIPTSSEGSCIRDKTIRELFESYPTFSKRKHIPDNYDQVTNKVCLSIIHTFNEKFRSYLFKVQPKHSRLGKLAKQNYDEGCQLLVVRTQQFVPVPYESENLIIKSITKTLSNGFRAYKLKIQFCDHFGNKAGEILIFDPILSLQLFNWWEPGYVKALNNKS